MTTHAELVAKVENGSNRMSGGSITKCGVCGKLKIYGQECVRCKENNTTT